MFMVLNFILKILFMYKKLKNTQGMPKNNYVLCMVHKSPYFFANSTPNISVTLILQL